MKNLKFMNYFTICLFALLHAGVTQAQDFDKTSYAIGAQLGSRIVQSIDSNFPQLDKAYIATAIEDIFLGHPLDFSEEEIINELSQLEANLQSGQPLPDLNKTSYAVGAQLGIQVSGSIQQLVFELDRNDVIMALKDVLTQQPWKMSDEEISNELNQLAAREQQIFEQAKRETITMGDEFREEYAKLDGVQTTESGMLYRIIVQGESSRKPELSDSVVVHYRGELVNGTQFDSSYERGEPTEFGLLGIIPGWSEILQLMTIGSKWEVVIPPELAYGDQGAPPTIAPGSTLLFEIDLIDIR